MPAFRPLSFARLPESQMRDRARTFADRMTTRRSVRRFSPEPLPAGVVEDCVRAAAQAPSGANKQPWTFVIVRDPALKAEIRAAAEVEERAFYEQRAPAGWLADLEQFGTDAHKPFLEEAPALIVVFAQKEAADGSSHYYVSTSVGIACGFLLAALHEAGLASLTHTPSPMHFLGKILGRPTSEKPFLLIPVGYPAPDCAVPDIGRKPLDEILVTR